MAKERSRLARNLQRMLNDAVQSRADAVNEANQLRERFDEQAGRNKQLNQRLAEIEQAHNRRANLAREIDNALIDLNKLVVQAKQLSMAVQIVPGVDKHGDPAFIAQCITAEIVKR